VIDAGGLSRVGRAWYDRRVRAHVLMVLALVTGPADLVAQEGAVDPVLVHLQLVSEGGSPVPGGVVRVEELTAAVDSAVPAVRLAFDADALSLSLHPGREYRIRVEVPGYRPRSAEISSSGPSHLRLVLSVDPYELPPIMAVAGGSGAVGHTRSVFQARFADEALTYATVGEWLRDVPGTTLHRRAPGGAQVLSVHGSRPEDVLVLLDGVPLNDPLTGRADLSTIPTSTLESGTLVMGTASQRYGSGASGGVLLLTSRSSRESGMTGGIRMGSFGEMGLDVQADASRPGYRLGLSLSAARAENDFSLRDPIVPAGAAEVRANADAASLHGVLHASSGPVFGSLRFDRTERGVPGRAGSRVFADARAEDRSWIMAAGFDERVARASASYGWHQLGYRSSTQETVSSQEVEEFRAVGDVSLPSIPLTLGGRVTREEVRGDGIDETPGRTTIGGRLAAGLMSGRFRLDPAISVDVSGARVAASPELAASWLPNESTRVWGRVGQGFRLPTFGDLYFASQYQLRANPDLEAERISFDSELGVGARSEAGDVGLDASASAWARRTKNPIVWLASTVALWSPLNLDELWAMGLDLQIELVSRSSARLGWRAQVTGTLQRSRVGFGGNRNPLPYEPGSAGRLSLEAWSGATGARVDVRYTGSRSTSLAATRSLPGFTTVDLSARQHVAAGAVRIGLFARIENIMDQRYELIELFPEPGRHFTVRIEAGRLAQ